MIMIMVVVVVVVFVCVWGWGCSTNSAKVKFVGCNFIVSHYHHICNFWFISFISLSVTI